MNKNKEIYGEIMTIQLLPILAFKDNYIWCLINEETKHCIIVDPGESKPVLTQLKQLNLTLDALFITHHHWDHTNGIRSILKHYSVPVFGPSKEKIVGVTHPVDEKDKIELSHWPRFEILAIPGHTLGHIAYYGNPFLFCGDTLFTAGCGRLFEGTPEQMLNSLEKLAQLPDETQIYCGHEYTLTNLNFAQTVEPDNIHIKERLEKTRELRQKNLPCVPSLLAEERLSNPFLRGDNPKIKTYIEKRTGKKRITPVEIFAYLRQWKNNFK